VRFASNRKVRCLDTLTGRGNTNLPHDGTVSASAERGPGIGAGAGVGAGAGLGAAARAMWRVPRRRARMVGVFMVRDGMRRCLCVVIWAIVAGKTSGM